MVLEAFPGSAIDYDNIEFYRGLLDHRYLASRCSDCGFWHVPPGPICPRCWSSGVEPTEVSGDGVVYMSVLLHRGAPSVTSPGAPYPIVTVELVEQTGLRISTMITACPRDELRIGLPVTLTWLDGPRVPLPVFRPKTHLLGDT